VEQQVPVVQTQPSLEAEPTPKTEHAPEAEPTPICHPPPVSDYIDPELDSALKRVKQTQNKQFIKLYEFISVAVGKKYVVQVDAPQGMYPEPKTEVIPLVEVAQIFSHDWLDRTLLHWFAM